MKIGVGTVPVKFEARKTEKTAGLLGFPQVRRVKWQLQRQVKSFEKEVLIMAKQPNFPALLKMYQAQRDAKRQELAAFVSESEQLEQQLSVLLAEQSAMEAAQQMASGSTTKTDAQYWTTADSRQMHLNREIKQCQRRILIADEKVRHSREEVTKLHQQVLAVEQAMQRKQEGFVWEARRRDASDQDDRNLRQ